MYIQDIILVLLLAGGILLTNVTLIFAFDKTHPFNELFAIRRNGRQGIRFLLIATYATLFECITSYLHRLIMLPKGKLLDGYALTLLGPFILIWWVFWFTFGGFFVLPILIVLWIPVLLYTVLFEFPASFLNSTKEIYNSKSTDDEIEKSYMEAYATLTAKKVA
jgi:hypothetical protein